MLFPALKAMGEGKTDKLLYLTARNTARQSPIQALERMKAQGLHARVSVLTAREKLCPEEMHCHPDFCPRARGHFLRQEDAVRDLLEGSAAVWTDEVILAAADRHTICPFELALYLSELADVVLMDMNYLFDPFAQAKRLFVRRRAMTALIDEAHHTLERVRESLSGTLDGRRCAKPGQSWANAWDESIPAMGRWGGCFVICGSWTRAKRKHWTLCQRESYRKRWKYRSRFPP